MKKIMTHDDVMWELPIPSAAKIFGSSLKSNSQPDDHAVFRSWMGLALNQASLKAVFPKITHVLGHHVDQWLSEAGPVQLDEKTRFMMVEVAVSAFGRLDVNQQMMDRLCEDALVVQKGLYVVPIYLPGTNWYKAVHKRTSYLKLLEGILRVRFEVDAAGCITESNLLEAGKEKVPGSVDTTLAVVQECYERKVKADVRYIAERLLGNTVAASETTSSTLLATMIAIALVPRVVERLRQEQAEVLSAHGSELTYEALQKSVMPYLDATVRESTRLLPSVHGVFRRAKRDFQIGDYTFKKGEKMMVSTDLLHALDPCCMEEGMSSLSEITGDIPLYVDPSRLLTSFQPERWLEENTAKVPNLHSFSFGQHSCLGMNAAFLEIKCALALLLRKSTWELLNAKPEIKFLPYTHLADGPAKFKFCPNPLKP
ncbi:hypothetical protein CEUSTIGMA_g7393.t1 [Chlamydomonas eustigma]|uniref:Cytochrome P450 n=1 Tax=Chlamydomonas eustigma TaxID=1157962 RepID=A0A250XA64_9CHLO|nr:hypothetical protein CEUSTIGMA_g7393.t1 [Chlamydomonas eustigma]|eukprot:GAX79954.1 hypothetical protein CEUSTIGMA_g7393.t1 [Chlamydomonas eustigma]